jgi:hypothetical protein
VWSDAAEFIGTRQFTRFSPEMPAETATELVEGWQRAVRATLFWARDKGEPQPTAKRKRKKRRVAQRPVKSRPRARTTRPRR